MRSIKYGGVVEGILDALETIGPMTTPELAAHLGTSDRCVASVTSRLLVASDKFPKRIRIKTWQQEHPGQRNYPRAVFVLGDGPDAKKVLVNERANHRVRVAESRRRMRMNSVFNIGGITVKTRS